MPFPLLSLIGPAAGLIGRIAGGAGQGASNQRLNENEQRLRAAQLQSADQLGRAGMDLHRRQFQQDEPRVQAMQSLQGSLLNRLQPLQMQGVSDRVRIPQMNSILSAIGPEARQAGSLLEQRGLSGLQNPTQFAPLQPMQMQALQKSGLLEKILGGVGLGGSLLGALGQFGNGPTHEHMSGHNLPIDPYGGG